MQQSPFSPLQGATLRRSESALLKHEICYVLGQLQDASTLGALQAVLADTQQHAMVRTGRSSQWTPGSAHGSRHPAVPNAPQVPACRSAGSGMQVSSCCCSRNANACVAGSA